MADEVSRRYVSATSPPEWRLVDTIESEITFKGSRESREHITVNGKPWNDPYNTLPGMKFTGGFGQDLRWVFDPNCSVTIELAGRVTEAGKSLSVVRYSSPPDGCLAQYWYDYQMFFAEQTGRVLLDEREENVIRIEGKSQGFPKAYPMADVETQVSWGYVKIGADTHLLPVSSDKIVLEAGGRMRLLRQEYKNHRHFEASSSITFH